MQVNRVIEERQSGEAMKLSDEKGLSREPAKGADALREPSWTVVYNICHHKSEWVGTGWEFFDDEATARKRLNELYAPGTVATLRRYYRGVDAEHLGAAHDEQRKAGHAARASPSKAEGEVTTGEDWSKCDKQSLGEIIRVLQSENASLRAKLEERDAVLLSFADNRCYACGWPLKETAEQGCVPFNCCFRPERGSGDYQRWSPKAHAMQSVLDAARQSAQAASQPSDPSPKG